MSWNYGQTESCQNATLSSLKKEQTMIGSVEDLNMYAQQLKSLPQDYYPYFDFCHIILCVLAVRKEAGRNFAWSHPVSAWISCVVASFAGSIICGPLLGIFFYYVFHTIPLIIPYFWTILNFVRSCQIFFWSACSHFLMFVMMLLLSVCHLIWHVLSEFAGKLGGNLTFRFYYLWFLVNLTHTV